MFNISFANILFVFVLVYVQRCLRKFAHHEVSELVKKFKFCSSFLQQHRGNFLGAYTQNDAQFEEQQRNIILNSALNCEQAAKRGCEGTTHSLLSNN